MLKQNLEKFLRRTHFWRDVGFDELSELYISNMLRTVALTIFMVFVPFYLFQNGYSPAAIFAMFGFFFVGRMFSDIGAAYMVARVGPKHTMIASCILQIVSASLLLTVPQHHWHITLLAIPWGASASLFFIAFHTVFSKIKHTAKAGAELSHMQIFERIGFMLGPLVGGVVGSMFGSQYIFLVATVLLIASLWPLFLTSEPTKVHQKLEYRKLPLNKVKYDFISYNCMAIENTLCINVWSFYVAVFLLSGTVYAQLGALSAVGVVAAILAAKVVGRLSDTNLARQTLRVSVVINALTYLVRPFVSGPWAVAAVNISNDAITTGYRMPATKGIYAAADDLPGLRIVYVSSLEALGSIAKGTIWFLLAILATVFALKTVLFIGFAIAGIASLGIMLERYEVYNTGKRA